MEFPGGIDAAAAIGKPHPSEPDPGDDRLQIADYGLVADLYHAQPELAKKLDSG